MDILDKKKKSLNYSLNKSLDKLESANNPQRDPSNKSREKELQEFESSLHQLRDKALSIYRHELNRPASIDLGLHGTSRAALRTLCKSAVMESSTAFRRRLSQSNASSVSSHKSVEKESAVSALRLLQKERLIVTRLGFPDKAMELDRQIEEMRIKAKRARDEEENRVLYQRMKNLAISHRRKEQRLETIIANELTQIKIKFQDEEEKMIRRQEVDFLRVLEAASRRALGRVKKCNCDKEYVCRHNKTASYNTRRPIYTVVLYRRNAKRLKRAGRPEEAQVWSEKANVIDDGEQEKWRTRVADSIVSSPWGANEASVDQITELHKKELAVLRKTHAVKLDMLEKKHVMRRKNFRNTILAEERKVRMQCRKQALLRLRKNYTEEQREEERQRALQEESDGLKNVSKNLLGADFTDADRAAIDWVPPVAFGLDNSVRLIDAVNEVGRQQDDESQGGPTRIFTSRADIAKMGVSEIQEKVRRVAGGNNEEVNSEEDSEEEEEEDTEEGEEDENQDVYYKLGETSGSKLVDKMRLQVHKDKMAIIAQNKEKGSNSSSQGSEAKPPSVLAQPPVAFSFPAMPNVNTGFPVLNNPFPASLPFAPGPLPFQSPNSTNTVTGGFLNRLPSFNLGAVGGNPFDNMTAGSVPGMAFANPFSPASTDIIDKTPTAAPAQTNDVLSYFNGKPAPKDDDASFTSPVRPIVAPPAPTAPAPTTPSFRAGMHINQSEAKSNNKAPPEKDIVDLNSRRVNQSQLFPDDSALNKFCHPSAEDRNATTRPHRRNTRDGHIRPVLIPGTNLTIPLALDWSFDPAVDENPAMSFEAGSRRDEDWQEHDQLLKEGFGSENSYGISLILSDETTRRQLTSQLSSSIFKIDNIVQIGHEPPAPGTPSSIPRKSSLSKKGEDGRGSPSSKKSATIGNNSTKKVKFGKNKVCTFEANDNEDEVLSNAKGEAYVPFVFPPFVELPFVQGSGSPMPSFSAPPPFLAANPFAPPFTPQLNTQNPFAFPQPSFPTAVSDSAKLIASGAAPPVQLSFEGQSNPLTGLENPMQSMRVSSFTSFQTASSDHSSLHSGSLPFEQSGPLQSSTIQSSIQSSQFQASKLDTVAASGHVDGDYDEDFLKGDVISPTGSNRSEHPMSDTPLVPHPPSAHRPPGARPSVMKGSEKGSASENTTSSNDQVLHTTPQIQMSQTFASPQPPQWSAQPPKQADHVSNSAPVFQPQSLQLPPQTQLQQLPFFAAPQQPYRSSSQANASSVHAPSSSFQIPPSVSNPFASAPSTSSPPTLMANFNVSPEDDNRKGGLMKSGRANGLNDSTQGGNSTSPTASYQQLTLNRHSSKTSSDGVPFLDMDDANSSAGPRGVQRCSFNWQLCFFRWTNLSNVVETLETVLNDDDFYEAAELYISTQDTTTLDENGEIDAFSASTNDVAWVQETTMKLQLLRGWKKFNSNPNDIELLLMGMEEVLGMDQEEIMEDVIGAIASKKTVLSDMLVSTAYEFIPNFIMSEDFASYFDSHYAPMKAVAKNFHVDSKSWLGRFQKTAADMNVPIHLFLPPTSKNGPRPRPFANKIMRSIFGTMVDAPSPREYIDNSTDPDTIENIMMSMKEGVDTTSGVVCRTLKTGKVPSFLYIKHLYSVKEPTKLKYSVVIIADRTKPNSDMLAKVATAMIQCLPTATKE
eukprot:gene28325-37256_t